MVTDCEKMLDRLAGPAREIADTVRREVLAAAPYAEFGLALGVPTWSFHERVLSLIPFTQKCNLHFWDGEVLADVVPGKLQGTRAGAIRYLELHTMLDVDADVRLLIREAFAHKLSVIAAQEAASDSNAALSHR